jgi:pterin-4a-carbinolamine dehydratase
MAELPDSWEARGRPPTLFRRFEFERYSGTRAFLDALAAVTAEVGTHPQNISFGTTYVNVTLEIAGGGEPGEAELGLAARISALYRPTSV